MVARLPASRLRVRSKLGLEDYWEQWHIFVPTAVLYASYIRYCQDHHDRYPQSRELFGKWMKSTGVNPGQMRNQATGEHMVDAVTTDGRTSRIAKLIRPAAPHGYTIGTLDEARQAFVKFSGLDIEWELTNPCHPRQTRDSVERQAAAQKVPRNHRTLILLESNTGKTSGSSRYQAGCPRHRMSSASGGTTVCPGTLSRLPR